MLFGSDSIRKQIVLDAKKYAEEQGLEIVYGAMVGGISKGLQYADSDYDTRFLYFDKNRPGEIIYPWNEKEEMLKRRRYFEEAEAPYEWIPFWEITSFFQFLKNPAFDHKVSYGLYNIVGWTLQSPYTWDPYGLAAKLMPLVNRIFRDDFLVSYQAEQIKTYWTQSKEIVIKDYLYALYAALTIAWTEKYHSFHPVYMKTLILSVAPKAMREKMLGMIVEAGRLSDEYLENNAGGKLHDSHFAGIVEHDVQIDKFIGETLEAGKCLSSIAASVSEDEIEDTLTCIYQVIEESVYNEKKVFRVS